MNPTLDIEYALDTGTLAFSHANALACAQWSRLAYARTSISNPETGAACFIAERDNAMVIAFRGSRTVQDFICDADFPRIAGIWGGVHSGFQRDIESVITPILKTAREMVARGAHAKPIFITGHSLGGALAILCARYFATYEIPVHAVYTFGQPRVGDAEFAAGYNAAPAGVERPGAEDPLHVTTLADVTFRIVNQCDIVPRVPGLLCGYRNVGQKIFIASFADFIPANPVIKNPKLWLILLSDAFGLWNGWANKKQLALLNDHFIAEYINELSIQEIPNHEE